VSAQLLFSSTGELRGNQGVYGPLQVVQNSDFSALFVHATESGLRKWTAEVLLQDKFVLTRVRVVEADTAT
jgi:hypothetical protein